MGEVVFAAAVQEINEGERAEETHWAFQPLATASAPRVTDSAWPREPLDSFVLARLELAGFAPSPEADRRALIRRATYAVTGLPPTPEEVDAFVADRDPRAYERLIDRLLDSPRYGEHFGRRWLDIARYSDTKGYVYAREERFWTHAWAYRDWVIRALNEDLPFDRFLLLQLAADGVKDRREDDLAAMGFLTLGRRFLGVKHDIIDDRIDVVTRGTMGLTVSCARCHDHKYDPVTTADYYSLYGIFDSSAERLTALGDDAAGDEAFRAELRKRRDKLRDTMAKHRAASSARVRARIGDYLKAQTELHKYPADGFDQIFEKTDLLPAFVRRWEARLEEADKQSDPIFVPWHAYFRLRGDAFARKAAAETRRLAELPAGAVHPAVARAFAEPPKTFQEVVDRYAKIFADVDTEWASALKDAEQKKAAAPAALSDPDAEALRAILYGPKAPCEVPDLPIVHNETFFASAETTELWKLQGEVDRWIVRSKAEAPFALSLMDRPDPADARILIRGNPLNPGAPAPRRFLAALDREGRPFHQGSGRLELARAIIDPANPLTARVIVNRVWAHLFGRGLVTTPSDFGLRADPPSHPQLLDWLASRLIADGWSLKRLHRTMLLSATFRQSSAGPENASARATALEKDPDNRLLWRMNTRRLTFEEFRDSMFAASGGLNLRAGGRPMDLFAAPFPNRRAVYGLVDRQFLPSTLRVFDFANPDLHIPKRAETTVPQQALFFLNHPLVHDRAAALAQVTAREESTPGRVHALFNAVLQRAPTADETAEAAAFIDAFAAPARQRSAPDTAKEWSYGYGKVDEAVGRVAGFQLIPHFTGEAWQGGPKWPNAKLGWVQLTATGGHPGNTRDIASVRRWTAPRAMTVDLRSRLIHEPAAGDGIRAFIVSSRAGILKQAKLHKQTIDLDLSGLTVAKGETIDFVVDIDKVLNSDQYLWSATLAETGTPATTWDSRNDFEKRPARQLTAWEQLAQTLLCSNEFLFVD